MIVNVFNSEQGGQPDKYSFTDETVLIGRNPPGDASVAIDCQTISRSHLRADMKEGMLRIMDLHSSTFSFTQATARCWHSSNYPPVSGSL